MRYDSLGILVSQIGAERIGILLYQRVFTIQFPSDAPYASCSTSEALGTVRGIYKDRG